MWQRFKEDNFPEMTCHISVETLCVSRLISGNGWGYGMINVLTAILSNSQAKKQVRIFSQLLHLVLNL